MSGEIPGLDQRNLQPQQQHQAENPYLRESQENNFNMQPAMPEPERIPGVPRIKGRRDPNASSNIVPGFGGSQRVNPPNFSSPPTNMGGMGSPTYASPVGKKKHMQALSLMNGPSYDERNSKLAKESEYRRLLKEQMDMDERKKEAARREKKEIQEAELREIMEFEGGASGKKISKDKKFLANTEFGGQGAKNMIYGGNDGGKSAEKENNQGWGAAKGGGAQGGSPKRGSLRRGGGIPGLNTSTFDDVGGNVPDYRQGGGEGGINALLDKPSGGIKSMNPYAAATGEDNPYGDEYSSSNPYGDAGGANPYSDVDPDLGMTANSGVYDTQQDTSLAKKAQQFDELSSMYSNLMEEQRAMREAIESQAAEMKKAKDREKDREKTLRAGQRGGLKGKKSGGSGPPRDAGGRLIRKAMGGGGEMLRTQSASRKRGEGVGGEGCYERGNDHYLSPGRKGAGRKGARGKGDAGSDRGMFGFKGGKGGGRSGGGSGPPRDAGGRLIRNKKEDGGRGRERNPYAGNDDLDSVVPGLKRVTAGGGPEMDPRQFSPRLEEKGGISELGGDSDLLYNDPNLDPAHGSLISADQLDRLMLRGGGLGGGGGGQGEEMW